MNSIKEWVASLLFILMWLAVVALPIAGTYLLLRWMGIL